MAVKQVVICDGCGSTIDTSKPWLHVNCNLHFEADGALTTGGVVELAFDKPACAIEWFTENQGAAEFKLDAPPAPQADMGAYPAAHRPA